jgi:RHS repeat-associated protein
MVMERTPQGADSAPEAEGFNLVHSPLPGDGTAMRNYSRQYAYDEVGNILSMIHTANNGNWTRNYAYNTTNNHLQSTTTGSTTLSYTHNEHGLMTAMPHLDVMDWDFTELDKTVVSGKVQIVPADYLSFGSKQLGCCRAKLLKITQTNTASASNTHSGYLHLSITLPHSVEGSVKEERLYLGGGFEIYRKYLSGVLETERETLHVMDDQKRIAQVETKTVDSGSVLASPVITQRYQLDNHLGSASVELDENAQLISYEEYYPYGSTSYQSGNSASEVKRKRYRYTGKEKDEESGLYYHGARYYAAWLGRWTAADPIGVGDGVNVYAYVQGNPVRLVDPSGNFTKYDKTNSIMRFMKVMRAWELEAEKHQEDLMIDREISYGKEDINRTKIRVFDTDFRATEQLVNEVGGEKGFSYNKQFGKYLDVGLPLDVSHFGKMMNLAQTMPDFLVRYAYIHEEFKQAEDKRPAGRTSAFSPEDLFSNELGIIFVDQLEYGDDFGMN